MRRGLSLLEVILALAILGITLAMLGELIRLGVKNGEAARDNLEAQLICESLINEIASGAQMPEMVLDSPIDDYGEWLATVEMQPVDQNGLMAVRVSVRRADAVVTNPNYQPYSLTRWMIDPAVELAARDAEAIMKEQLAQRDAAQESGTSTSNDSDTGSENASGQPDSSQQQTPMPEQGNNNQGRRRPELPEGINLPDGIRLPPDGQLPPGLKLPDGFDPSQLQRFNPNGGGGGRGGRGGRGGGSGPGGGRGGN